MIDLAELPSRRDEAWRWSDLRAAVGGLAAQEASDRALLTGTEPDRRLARVPLHSSIAAFAAPEDVLAYDVAAGEERVLQFSIEALAGIGAHSVFINVAEGAAARILETYVAEPGALGGLDIVVNAAAGARVERIVTARESADAILLSHARIRLEAHAAFRQCILAEGAKLARIETQVDVFGEGARVELNGAYMVGAGRHADLTSVVTHDVAGATTNQLIKGVARRGGRGVFQGKIEVARGAQQTDARQRHAGLMLEEGAEIFAKPELVIFADDVQCAHGNTIGALDEAALFYMRQRGVPAEEARALLVQAFLAEALPDWLSEDARADAERMISAWLGGAR